MSLFSYAKQKIRSAIDARYTEYSIERNYSDHVEFRYEGKAFVLETEDGDTGNVIIAHGTPSFNPQDVAFVATFSEKYQVDDMLFDIFGRNKPAAKKSYR